MRRLWLCLIVFAVAAQAFGQDYPHEFQNGRIERIRSEALQEERIVFIYLPTDYDKTNRSYPVHYVTDAPGTANLFYDLLRLHAIVNAVPQSIVVGLQSDNREHNLHVEKGAAQYLDFIENEVIPFVEKNYRTKSFRAILGHSLGGGFAIHAFLCRTDLFNLCIAGSPYPLDYLAKEIAGEGIANKTPDYRFLYASIGTVRDIDERDFDNFKKALLENAPSNLEYAFQINDGESHISNVAVNFQDGLQAFYAGWQFVLPDTLSATADVLLAEHYERLSEKVGYSVEPGEWDVLFPVMDQLAKHGDFENAIQVLKYCVKLYPQSDQAYAFLARACMSIGDKESARTHLEKALSINPENGYALELKSLLK